MTVSIKDVARMAGVSTASVSRVITGSPGVGEETAERIRKVMEELGYRPNLGARSLVKKRTGNIAVAFPRGSSFILGNPFFTRVLEGIAEVLDKTTYNMMISFTLQQQKKLLEAKTVDGIILFSPRTGEIDLKWLTQSELPIVVVGSYIDESPFPCVRPDDEGGIAIGVHALYELGHRKIGLVNGPSSSMKSRRCLNGYRKALAELNIPYEQEYVYEISEFDAVIAAEIMKEHLNYENGVTGLVCAADYLAMGVMKAAAIKGMSVPKDLSIVGFGDVPFSEFFIPALSSTHVDLIGIGRQAAEMLIGLVDKKRIRNKERVFKMQFIARGSTSSPRR